MIQQTSLDAFIDISGSLGDRQLQVYDFFRQNLGKDFTNTELSYALRLPINRITPRVYELRQKGLIIQHGIRYCRITGKLVITI